MVLQQSFVKSSGRSLIFAALCDGRGEEEKEFSLKIGEWFQNNLTRNVSCLRFGRIESHIEDYLRDMPEKIPADTSMVLCVDMMGLMWQRGRKTEIIYLQQTFGKAVLHRRTEANIETSAEEKRAAFRKLADNAKGFVVVKKGLGIILSEGADISGDARIAKCLDDAESEEEIERALCEICEGREVSAIMIRAY